MNKKIVVIVVATILFLAVGVYCIIDSEQTGIHKKYGLGGEVLVVTNKSSVKANKPNVHKPKIVREIKDVDVSGREKPVLLGEDDEALLSPEMKRIIADLQEALDREDRKSVSKLAAKIQEMIKKGGSDAVPVAVRMKAVEAIGWFLPDSLADLVPFMGDSDPDVIDDVMTAFEDALDNISMGDRELSQVVKSISRALSNDDALDALFFCVESDMRNSVAVDTYKYLMKNGSEACKARVLESIEDFTGEDYVKSEADLDKWLKENPDDEDDEDFYAGEKDDE